MSAQVKTPEEIARDIIMALDLGEGTEGHPKEPGDLTHAYRSGWLDGDSIPDLIAEAIRADRTQRAPTYCQCVNPEDGCDCEPPRRSEVVKRSIEGIKGRWLRMGYTRAEAADVVKDARGAVIRALREVGL